MSDKLLHTLLFVFRCVGSALTGLALAAAIGLEYPVWSAMSALIVSQEKLDDTRASVFSRILGTVIGIGAACIVNLAIGPMGASVYLQIALALTACALLVHHFTQLRVSMWTCALILASPSHVAAATIGLNRGEEVILGTLIGGLFHAMAEGLLRVITKSRQP